jgi:hypothetical protein
MESGLGIWGSVLEDVVNMFAGVKGTGGYISID